MTYNVQVGDGGYTGWKLLERTSERQKAIFEKDSQIQRSRDYFMQNISKVEDAEDLVSNYKLLSVTLRALGMDDDLKNRAFIKKILEADPSDSTSVVNRLTDKRYLKLNQMFGFGTDGSSSTSIDAASIAKMYVTRSFEKNIGEQHEEIELALSAQRELPELVSSSSSNTTKWYRITATPALRKVFEGAFGFPSTFSSMPVDRQVEQLKSGMQRMFGSQEVSSLSAEGNMDRLIKTYLVRNQTSSTNIATPFSTALTILRG